MKTVRIVVLTLLLVPTVLSAEESVCKPSGNYVCANKVQLARLLDDNARLRQEVLKLRKDLNEAATVTERCVKVVKSLEAIIESKKFTCS